MPKTKSKSESIKIQCRVCRFSLLRKGYNDNIKTQHPEEEISDLNTFGQQKLQLSYFSSSESKRKKEPESLALTAHQTKTMMMYPTKSFVRQVLLHLPI